MKCKSCGGPVRVNDHAGYELCQHCGTRNRWESIEYSLEGLQVLDLPLETNCPRCHEQISAAMIDKLPAKHCTGCEGTLISTEDFGFLIRSRRASYKGPEEKPIPLNPQELSERCDCPDCQQTMECHPYYGPGNVVVDSCAGCGWIWLDGAEFNRLVSSPGLRARY